MIQDGRNGGKGVASDEARATAATQSNPSVSSTAGIANAYHGDFADPDYFNEVGWKAVQQAFCMDEPEPENLLYANYVYEDYTGDAAVIWLNPDGSFGCVFGGHCSCYSLEGQWEPEIYSAEVVKRGLESADRWSIFQRHKDVFAQAIETRRAETQSGSVHESAVHAPKHNQEPTNG